MLLPEGVNGDRLRGKWKMKIFELLKRYDFHDSLVEMIDSDTGEIRIRIDFCSWKQPEYDEAEKETKEMFLIFKDVRYADIPEISPNDDEIIEVKSIKDNDGNNGVELLLFNDVKGIMYSIKIYAEDVLFNGV